MMWRDFVNEAYERRASATPSSFPRFAPGVVEAHLQQVERRIGQPLPGDVRAFLSESDGVMDVMKVDGRLIETGWLMWTADAIVEGHRDPSRSTLGPPSSWLVFSNAGADGIVFAYDRKEADGHIWAWHPMERRRQHKAESLAAFLRGLIMGELTV